MKLTFLAGLATAALLAAGAQALTRGAAAPSDTGCCAPAAQDTLAQETPPERQNPPAAAPAAAPVDEAERARLATIKAQLPSYPLTTCPISGKELGSMGEPVDVVVDGHLVRLCCGGCKARLVQGPAAAIAAIEAGVKAQEAAHYPLTTCPISGEELGGMGRPVEVVVGTRLVRLCCGDCQAALAKDPAAALAKIDAAYIAQQLPHYPLTTCPISGEELGAGAKNVLYGTRLVRFCCGACVKKFDADPKPVLAALDAATRPAGEHGESEESEPGQGGDQGQG